MYCTIRIPTCVYTHLGRNKSALGREKLIWIEMKRRSKQMRDTPRCVYSATCPIVTVTNPTEEFFAGICAHEICPAHGFLRSLRRATPSSFVSYNNNEKRKRSLRRPRQRINLKTAHAIYIYTYCNTVYGRK